MAGQRMDIHPSSEKVAASGVTASGHPSRQILAILVHGTWARNAPWCLPDSHFCRTLQADLGNSIQFDIFSWSGWNLHRARILAGLRLSDHILHAVSRHPEAKIVLVGHSHGGNVIRYALRRVDAARHITGVITLATPFITLTARPFTEWLGFLIKGFAFQAMVIAFGVVGAMVLYCRVIVGNELIGHILDTPIAFQFVILPLGLVLFDVLRRVYMDHVARYMAVVESKLIARQQEIVATIDPPKIEGLPLQSIEVRADEARFVLRASDFLSGWSQRMLRSRLVNKLAHYGFFPFMLVLLGLRIYTPPSWTDYLEVLFSYSGWSPLLLLVLAVILTSLLVPFIVSLLFIISVAVPRVVKAPIFGEETLYESWLLNSVQSAKPIDWSPDDHHIVEIERESWHLWRALRHSLVYTNPTVTALVADWIKRLVARQHNPRVSVSGREGVSLTQTDFQSVISAVLGRLSEVDPGAGTRDRRS
jgi:hypothetical protein